MHWPSETEGVCVTVAEERLTLASLRLSVSIALEEGRGVVDEAAHFMVARKQKDRIQLPWPTPPVPCSSRALLPGSWHLPALSLCYERITG